MLRYPFERRRLLYLIVFGSEPVRWKTLKGAKSKIDNARIVMKVSRTSHSRAVDGPQNRPRGDSFDEKTSDQSGCLLASLSIFAQGPQTYKGEIIDSQCAALGGHQIMEQKGESPKDCTNRCVNMGGKYTLFDPNQDRLSTRRSEEKRRIRRGESSSDRNPEPSDQDHQCGQHQGRFLAG